jgi:HemY protein
MIRILLFIAGVIVLALAVGWIADRPGTVTLQWLGYEVKTSAFFALVALAAIVAVLLIAWSLFRYVVTRPSAVATHLQERRKKQGFDALTKGLLAIGVGDKQLAQRYSAVARRNLPNEPLTALLKAQTAQLSGDRAAAQRAFEAMLQRPETELLGLRGLFLEATRGGNNAAARALADQVVKRQPQLSWGVNALFELQARSNDWEGALDTLAVMRQHGNVEPDVATRRRAVLLTAEGRALESSQPEKALTLANEALRLAPSLIPAAETAGRVLASKGEAKQASRLISRTWKLAPHPDLAVVYAFANPSASPRERLKRVKHLAGLTPGEIEGQIAVAVAAIDAREWQEAEAALSPYLEDRPSARVCALMARIEAGEGNKGREREWLARAVRAPRDRVWIADGYVSDRWLPVSPVTGAVDAFQWKAPVDLIGRGDSTLLIEDIDRPAEKAPPLEILAAQEPEAAEREESAAPAAAPSVDGATPPPEPAPAVKSEPVSAEPSPRARPPKPSVFVPPPAPDDPGVAPQDADESPASLERLRAAQIR